MQLLPKLISHLLRYPDEELLRSLSNIEEMISESLAVPGREEFAAFLDYLRRTPLIGVQEEYTETFDLNPALSLNLSHHRWGEGRERGGALAALSGLYREEGYEMSGGELPDYLPLILEFTAICSEEAGGIICADYREEVQLLAGRLEEKASPYAALVGMAARLFERRGEPQNIE